MEKIAPLGIRDGRGTFDTFFDTKKYKSLEEADHHDDVVVVDFVKDDSGTIFFEAYGTKRPDIKRHHRLNYQRFPAGIDVSDDAAACELADALFGEL